MRALRLGLPSVLVLCSVSVAAAQETADYVRNVKPILKQHCVACHGPKVVKAKLRLDTAAGVRKGGARGPAVVPGKAAESPLIDALKGANDFTLMPFNKPALPEKQIRLLAAWIEQGAKAPANEVADDGSGRTHWAFQPPKRPPVPAVKDTKWPRNAIDHFLLARLEREGIRPSPEADRVTLLRRVSLDLLGLPPSPEEVSAFLNDRRPDAYERVVERLLASPHYGERWGRHWLDLARYADSNGYSIDSPRTIWPYRDWVINALNKDMPFDQFTVEQLAGDLLPDATREQKIATGFHRNTLTNEEGGIDPEQFRVEAVLDRVNTTASVWLGLTFGCAQCHNHKYDPFRQREYYQMFAFFNNQDEENLPLGAPDPNPSPPKKFKKGGLTTLVLKERATTRETHVLQGGDFTRKGAKVGPGTPAVLPPLVRKAEGGKESNAGRGSWFVDRETHNDTPREASHEPPPAISPPNRLDLARWLVRPDNPLTARVLVNRVWGQYFGIGLVETENDFGTRGTPPSHPELLDWLAAHFMKQGWSLKGLHRLIVTSATYRQSSRVRPELETMDPRNRLLARQARLRLDAEVIRDVALAASGLLNRRVGGPSVHPPQPDGIYRFTQVQRPWKTSTGPDRYRRGLYTFFQRSAPYPALTVFDAPDANSACTRRGRSNTPLQALTLLNDQAFLELARGLADRVLREGPDGDPERLRYAFRLCLAREPSSAEAKRLETYLHLQLEEFRAAPAEAQALLAPPAKDEVGPPPPPDAGMPRRAAWTAVARVLLNLDEFITRE
jgi:mono/diheme cytochrome c family protein